MKIHQIDTVVVGSGCAALNAADWLWHLGKRDMIMVTDGFMKGTSRNTGSDKQTYYKLSLCGQHPDSVYDMAKTLYAGGGVEGDIALAEAAGSVQCFMKLVNLGVPFPTNALGEYVGYQTDHDATKRATSAGPLTSRYMTQVLEKEVKKKKIPIWDSCMAVRVFTENNRVCALLCLEENEDKKSLFHLIFVRNIVWCTGGPSGCYYYSVYPKSQTGMSGVLLKEGVCGRNLQEWQYGLASVSFRWNVSGTYQQAIPRYISVDSSGVEREFLLEHEKADEMPGFVFLKGYQWPFDVKKAETSSLIDRLVYRETILKGRKVYMDFRRNPSNLSDFSHLLPEAYEYLKRCNALDGTPIDRLKKMNPMAIELYRNHGIDLYQEPLEIMVCAQHHNGGISVDTNWQSSVKGLYVAGEAAGTFGPYRPGGTALNSTQVGSMRAALHIMSEETSFLESGREKEKQGPKEEEKRKWIAKAEYWIAQVRETQAKEKAGREDVMCYRERRQKKMSSIAAHMRNLEEMRRFLQDSEKEIQNFFDLVSITDERQLPVLFQTYDMLLTQSAVLSAMIVSAEVFGNRGSAMVEKTENLDEKADGAGEKDWDKQWKIVTDWDGKTFISRLEKVKPIPPENDWFEVVWAQYREKNKRYLEKLKENGNQPR